MGRQVQNLLHRAGGSSCSSGPDYSLATGDWTSGFKVAGYRLQVWLLPRPGVVWGNTQLTPLHPAAQLRCIAVLSALSAIMSMTARYLSWRLVAAPAVPHLGWVHADLIRPVQALMPLAGQQCTRLPLRLPI